MTRTVIKNSVLGEYTLAQLDCGLSVYIMEKEGFSSSFAVFGTRYGSVDTTFSRNGEPSISVPEGIAHFLEYKLFECEEEDAFAKFAATGAYANAFTSFDRTCYLFSCVANFKENLDILLDFVQTPYFTEETVKKEQGIIGQEIKMYEDSPGWRVLFNMLGCMYTKHPVKIDIAGTVDSIAKIDYNLLYESYKTFYNPANMFVCIAGNVKTDEVLAQIENGIKITDRVKIERAEFEDNQAPNQHYIEQRLEVAKPIFCLGFKEQLKGEVQTVREKCIADIALELIASECSPLYKRLIDASLINDEFSYDNFSGPGYSAIIFDGESSDPKAVSKEILKEIGRISREGIDKKMLEAVKRALYGDAVRRFDNTEGIVMNMVECAVSNGELFDTIEELKSINEDDILNRIKGFTEESSVLSVILPKEM
ncbi:MAG: insulinase family protein [Clostridia bacterium]|nr:insulinase family protein [Clostridia bacterium]